MRLCASSPVFYGLFGRHEIEFFLLCVCESPSDTLCHVVHEAEMWRLANLIAEIQSEEVEPERETIDNIARVT